MDPDISNKDVEDGSWEYVLYKLLFYIHFTEAEPFPGAIGLSILVIILTTTITIILYCRIGNNVKEKIPVQIRSRIKSAKEFVVPSEGPRFRKRDKIAFLGQRMVKRIKTAGSLIRGGQGRKRKMIAKFAKRLLGQEMSPETLQASKLPLPLEYLEEDTELGNEILPEQLKYVLQNMRVFGHFEQPIFLEIVKQIEYMSVPANQYLFQVGDPDENIFIVQTGQLNVLATDNERQTDYHSSATNLKYVKPGDAIMSLLSFLDHLSGKSQPYKTVNAKAVEDTKVIKLPFSAFKIAFEKYPDAYLRVVQIVMIRLQRVTLLALHQYLGLGAELIASQHRGNKNLKYRLERLDSTTNDGLPPRQPSALQLQISNEKRRKSSLEKREDMIMFALKHFKEQLGLESEATLEGKIEIREIPEGYRIMEEDSLKDAALVLVIQGCFNVSQTGEDGKNKLIHYCYPGGLLGQLQVLTGEPSFFTVCARTASYVACLSRDVVFDIMSMQPDVTLHLAASVIEHMSSFVRSIDFALDWMLIESGRALYRQGEEADCTYVVLSGRLRSVLNRNGNRELAGEYGRGELCGIIETLTGAPRSTTLLAVRDTEVAKLPAGLINNIKLRHPVVVSRLISLLGKRLLSLQQPGIAVSDQTTDSSRSTSFSTVALVGVTPGIPLSVIAHELVFCLNSIGPAKRISPDVIRATLGPSALDPGNDYKLSAWLGSQEDQHRIVVYQADSMERLTSWTQQCIRHADCILILAWAHADYKVSSFEEKLETVSLRTTKQLVLLHSEDTELPKNTSKWLEGRSWISGHYHVKIPSRLRKQRREHKLSEHYRNLIAEGAKPDIHSDIARLSRMLTGTSVGLVLGGGGARGCSHVGMIKSILEAGIPIDRVAGVSIGAFMGALYCQERDVGKMTVKARSFCHKMGEKWRLIVDLTYPYTSMLSGFGFNTLIEEVFTDTQVEDLWLPFFTITTDISVSSMRVHEMGSTWRYVRGSMSLASYMPPICDPVDGHHLLDGGYVNNLPADIMHKKGANHILAVDVGSQDETDLHNFGDWLSGWQILWLKLNPFSTLPKIPSQADIQLRLAYVSCVRQLEEVKNASYCDYIRPPIDKYGILQFDAFEEIRDVGYHHGKTYFAGLRKAGQLGWITNDKTSRRNSLENLAIDKPVKMQANYARFTDLAEMVCRVRENTPDERRVMAYLDDDDEIDDYEDEDEYLSETEPDDSDLLTDPDDCYIDDDDLESGFNSTGAMEAVFQTSARSMGGRRGLDDGDSDNEYREHSRQLHPSAEQGEGGDVDILRSAHLVLDDGADDAAVAENIVHADAGLHADADDALQVKDSDEVST